MLFLEVYFYQLIMKQLVSVLMKMNWLELSIKIGVSFRFHLMALFYWLHKDCMFEKLIFLLTQRQEVQVRFPIKVHQVESLSRKYQISIASLNDWFQYQPLLFLNETELNSNSISWYLKLPLATTTSKYHDLAPVTLRSRHITQIDIHCKNGRFWVLVTGFELSSFGNLRLRR